MSHQPHSPVFLSYWPENSPHAHGLLVTNGDISIRAVFTDIEEYAEELAEQVAACGSQAHGKGRDHPHEEVEKAYKMAVFHLLTKDFDAEWKELQRQIRVFKKWGGTPPAAVMLPNAENPREWEVLIPDKEGNPYMYKMHKGVMEDILDPRDTGKPNKHGLGWTIDKGKN